MKGIHFHKKEKEEEEDKGPNQQIKNKEKVNLYK